jgi:hypothetical protein
MFNIKKIIISIDKKIFFEFFKNLTQKLFIKYYQINYIFAKNNKYDYLNIHYYNFKKNILSELCEKYGSDKGYLDITKKPWGWPAHSYANFYYNLFNDCKNEIKLVFECGIGTNNKKIISNMSTCYKPGASLRVWRDYFKNSLVYGADIDKEILFEEDRIFTFYINQLESRSIKEMCLNINKNNFDIIIDDGLHSYEAAITLFLNSFYKLKKRGIYIIEDVHFNYINKLSKELIKYNPEVILLNDKNAERLDNNLILIRKD